MTAYKDITAEEMTILARAIVDQNETPEQESCPYCHRDKESYKRFSNFALSSAKIGPRAYQKYIWTGKLEFLSNDMGAEMTMLGKTQDGFVRINLVKNITLLNLKQTSRIFTRKVHYCDHCGRRLD